MTAQEVDDLLALKKAQYKYVKSREIYEGSLHSFVKAAWSFIDSSQFISSWAIEAFCEHLEAVTYGYIPRLLANYPPRASKTMIASIAWPAWIWAQSEKTFLSGPQVRFLCGSYNSQLSLMNANKMRRLINSPFYQNYWAHRFMLTWDQNTKSQFDNTKGGSRLSTSVRGGLLGLGGDLLIVDDPHNTETEKVIETDADRRLVASWWQELHSTRLNDPKQSAIVVVMQRLHENDLSGIILDSDEDWTHLMIPMEFDESRRSVTVILPRDMDDEDAQPWTDPRTKDGELMWPERFGPREVQNLKSALGPFMAAGRLQQSPTPKGGGIIKREWWQPWDSEEARRYGLEWNPKPGGLKEFPPFELVCGSLDTAFKEKQENDFNALTIFGFWVDKNKNRRAMLMFAWAKKLPLHGKVVSAKPGEAKVNFQQRQQAEWGLVEWVADTCKRYKVRRLFIEDKARGTDVAAELTRLYARENWGVQLMPVDGDKTSRVHAVVPLFVDGAIWAPDTKWADAVISEVASFPKGAHDDFTDSVSMLIGWARDQELLVRGDEMSAALEEEMMYKGQPTSVAQIYGV